MPQIPLYQSFELPGVFSQLCQPVLYEESGVPFFLAGERREQQHRFIQRHGLGYRYPARLADDEIRRPVMIRRIFYEAA